MFLHFAGADMQLQEPIYDNMSQDVTAEAMIWLQQLDVDAGVKMGLQDNLQNNRCLGFCRNLRFVQIHGLSKTLYLVFFCLEPM